VVDLGGLVSAFAAIEHPALARAGLVWSGPLGAPGARASGYLLDEAHLLTCAHVLSSDEPWVRLGRDREWRAATVVFRGGPDDVAVVQICDKAPSVHGQVDFGVLPVDVAGNVKCVALGFPAYKEYQAAPDHGDVDIAQVDGVIPFLDNAIRGGLTVLATDARPDRERRFSPWSGLSGAAVFVNGLLVGVQSSHAPAEGDGSLRLSRAADWCRRPPFVAAIGWSPAVLDVLDVRTVSDVWDDADLLSCTTRWATREEMESAGADPSQKRYGVFVANPSRRPARDVRTVVWSRTARAEFEILHGTVFAGDRSPSPYVLNMEVGWFPADADPPLVTTTFEMGGVHWRRIGDGPLAVDPDPPAPNLS
jgi:hypothetical protein